MAKVTTLGLTTIGFAPIASDGGPGTVFTNVESTKKDTAEMTHEDPTKTELFEEETDQPYYTAIKNGKISFTFALAQPDVTQLSLFFGGTVSNTTPKTWDLPDGYVAIERTVKITPRVGLSFLIPRGLVTAKMGGKFGTTDSFAVTITVDVLSPTKAGVKALTVTNPA